MLLSETVGKLYSFVLFVFKPKGLQIIQIVGDRKQFK